MSSKYQGWITHDGDREKMQIPVLPEKITIKKGIETKSVTIMELGEILLKGGRKAITITFSSFFPAASFPGIQVDTITPPSDLKDKLTVWQKSNKPVHFIVTGTTINLYVVIDNFTYYEEGGDVGTLNYTLSLKEYREVKVRQVTVAPTTNTVSVPPATDTRTDNREQPRTHTVVAGDCLWNIAKKYLGSGSRYTEIVALNSDLIKNPNLIYPGWVLKIPA